MYPDRTRWPHADEDQDAKDLADALAHAERLLHSRENLAADQQCKRERRCRAQRISKQQQGGVDAGALKRGAGEDESQDRTGAGRPQQSGGDAEHCRGPYAVLLPFPLRQTGAEGHQGPSHPIRDAGKNKRDSEQCEEDQRSPSPGVIGPYCPASADGRKGRDHRKGRGHSGQHRQGRATEATVGARENERQYRQDAWAEDGEDAAEIGEKDDQQRLTPFIKIWLRRRAHSVTEL